MDLTRRTFLKLMAQVVLTAGLSSHFPRLAEAADTGTMPIQYIRQIITHDPRTSRTIMWQSTVSIPDCQVEYRPEAQRLSIAQAASMTSLTEDSTTNYFYSVTLTGLQPGTVYSYRIVDTSRATGWHTFSTAPAAPEAFSALYLLRLAVCRKLRRLAAEPASCHGQTCRLSMDSHRRRPDR